MKKCIVCVFLLILSADFILCGTKTYSRKKLYHYGRGREFRGNDLKTIAFPIGGLGTGNITIGGRGEIKEVEIFNRPKKGSSPQLTFFSIWVKKEGKEPLAKILERKLLPPYMAWMGVPRYTLPGVARFEEAVFRGEYPFAYLTLKDREIPVDVCLEAYNPYIPLSPEKSGIPVAVFNWRIKNSSRRPVMVSIALSMMNPIRTLDKAGRRGFGHNINHYINEGFFQGIYMLSLRGKEKDIGKGTIAFITPEKDVDVQTRWYRGGWWDNAHLFWDDFSRDGRLVPCTDSVPAPEGRTDVASLLVHCQLKPGEEKVVPFYLTWHFPWRENYWNREKEVKGKVFRNYYATKFKDALHVARFVVGNLETLYQDTKAFHDLLFSSTYPSYAIEAVSSQASSLKTNLVMQTEDGKFFGFEGLSDDRGCCPMNCTHVWNYEQTLAFLFPSLERTMRETDFMHNTFENGYQVFRTLVPLGDYWWTYKPCADGQMGNIVRVYREWKMSGDSEWLAKLWPRVKAALEFAWNGVGEVNSSFSWQKERLKLPWDPDRDGCMEGEQHNTYDIEFYGPNTMTGSLYLAALKACAEMAEAMGEPETARRYRNIFEQGSEEYDRTLWNGEYYIQKIDVMDGLVIPQHLRSPERDSEEISGRSSRFAEGKEEREEAVSSFCLF